MKDKNQLHRVGETGYVFHFTLKIANTQRKKQPERKLSWEATKEPGVNKLS